MHADINYSLVIGYVLIRIRLDESHLRYKYIQLYTCRIYKYMCVIFVLYVDYMIS